MNARRRRTRWAMAGLALLGACSAGTTVGEPGPLPDPETMAAQLFAEMNRLRSRPAAFIPILERMKQHFHGKQLRMPGEVILLTTEGVEAVEEAIAFLRGAKPLAPLRLSRGMTRAAADHVGDMGRSGRAGHTGSDGSTPSTRLRRHGAWKRVVAENVALGSRSGARMLLQLLIDDGVPDRGHRNNLFRAEFGVVGVACGPHSVMRSVCVIDFAGDFVEGARKWRRYR